MSSQERLKDLLTNKFNRLFHSFVSDRRRSSTPNLPLATGPNSLLLLPSELKHRIADLSSYDTLASLARTHSAFQREAEQVLYRTISVLDPGLGHSVNCLKTLATNPEKAGFVHFLAVERFGDYEKPAPKFLATQRMNDNAWRALIDYLSNALPNMHLLSDFRLRLPRGYKIEPWVKILNKILCNNHFRLQTLCCDDALDLSRIITSQTELQKLGINEYYGKDIGFFATLKRLQNAQLHLPVVFTFDHGSFQHEGINRISIFPPFYDSTVHQVLAEYRDIDQDSRTLAAAHVIDALSIYLVDSYDLPSIHVLTKNMAMTFSNIFMLTISFENPCERIPSQEIKSLISLFPNLWGLELKVWPHLGIGDGKISGDVKRAHEALAKDWLQKEGSWETEWSLA